MAPKRPLKLTVANLSDKLKDNPELLEQLQMKKSEIDMLSTVATEIFRKAAVAKADADIALANVTKSIQSFMILAGQADEQIAREPSAMPPYINSKGELCVDIPYTQREQRLAARVAHHQLQRQAEQIDDDPELFDEGDQDQQ